MRKRTCNYAQTCMQPSMLICANVHATMRKRACNYARTCMQLCANVHASGSRTSRRRRRRLRTPSSQDT
eukprot:4222816-Pleurochrysis_carterae.AAC.1